MNYVVEKLKSGVKFEISVPTEEWNTEIDAAYAKNKGKYNIPGFRKGHAPKKVIEKMYGVSVFFDDAFNSCASKAYSKALSENVEIIPVDDPKVDISDMNDKEIKFTMEVTVKPDAVLGEYKGLTVEKAVFNVTDTEIDAEIERSRQSKSRTVDITDRAVKDGDTVNLDYSGSVDGVKFNGGTANGQELTIGSNTFIPGFEPQLIGLNIGDNKDVNVKFPEDYHAEELKGKDAIFSVKINAIKEKQVPELNDDFVKDTSAFENLADYRADVAKKLTEKATQSDENEKKNRVIEKVVSNATVDVPDCMIESELDYMLQDFEYRLSYMYGGMKLDDYFKYTGSSREDFRKDRREDARTQVKTRLVMEEIIKVEKVEATDADVDSKLEEIAKQANKSLQEYKPEVSAQQINHIKNDIIVNKVMDLLVAANKFVAKAE